MTLKHSPGPWSVHTDAEGWMSIQDAEARFVTEIGRDIDANARLMKAAPEMLLLLREVSVPDYDRMIAALGKIEKLIARLDGDT